MLEAAEETCPMDLSELIPEQEWRLHRAVLEAAAARGLPFALGGGLAFSAYSGRWRNTKDMDLFLLPTDREAMIAAVTGGGFDDYYEQEPYDRSWIYRGFRDGVIVDVIWQMANHRAPVDEAWLTRGQEVEVRGFCLKLVPPEEMLFSKLYVVQRTRCDWPDLLNVLSARGPEMDWEHLLRRVGEDAPLLGALVHLFRWMCPERARDLPPWIWRRMGLYEPESGQDGDDRHRVALLDSRDWFGPAANTDARTQ